MYKRTVFCLVIFSVAATASAEFMQPDLEKVPVNRLLKNLEEKLKYLVPS